MKTLSYSFRMLAILALVNFLSSCGGGNQQTTTATDTTKVATVVKPTYDATKIDATAPVMEVPLEASGTSMTDMKYSNTDIHVKSGTTVKISFTNKSVGDAMQHNFVLVYKGKKEAVATAGLKAGADKGYIDSSSPDILVSGKVLKPGESETITFPAPPAGEYEFVCTYPGHWQMMNGKFTVE